MLNPSDCHPGTLIQCIVPEEDLFLGEIYTIQKLHDPTYFDKRGNEINAHSLSLEEMPDNPGEDGCIDVFGLQFFRLVPKEEQPDEIAISISERIGKCS